jgi:hypothetical protein
MKRYRKIGILIILLLIVIQFVQPVKNKSDNLSDDDISKVYDMPQVLHQVFVNKCYDCHSNNTNYPWYFNIQPVGWWLAAHVHDGKEHLDFSAFRKYPADKAAHNLEEISEVIDDGSMPLKAYTFFHEGAELTIDEKKAIHEWLSSVDNH